MSSTSQSVPASVQVVGPSERGTRPNTVGSMPTDLASAPNFDVSPSPESATAPTIGIALSGGGSRAIAFHLGCLRTLHRLGILQRARVMSTVSGGSVIGAMWAVHEGSFEDFEARVRATLAEGFVHPAIRTAFTTSEGLKALLSFTTLVLAWAWSIPPRLFAWAMHRIAGAAGTASPEGNRWMPRRFASRTTLLCRTFDRLLFTNRTLGSLAPGKPNLVVVAAELTTGSAFYFTSQEAGSWRIGKLDPRKESLAHAVAASAAFPLLLPALDETPTFRKRDGSLRVERVTLTDGGVYDNLGLAPLWPDRDHEISVAVEPVDTIVACRAGYGLRTGSPSLFLFPRMLAVFDTVFNRAQNASMKRLFDLKAAGRLRGFALPYLDQVDERLAFPPPDLVRRDEVAGYPTNFSAMPTEWIEKLSKRGEQLTLAVIREHAPDLLPRDWDASASASCG